MNDVSKINLVNYPTWPTTAAMSPFRYPGGKGFLTGFLANEVGKLEEGKRHYIEPFAGGAGAAVNLLKSGSVSRIHLNDLDIRIYSAWKAIVDENDRFIEELNSCEVTLDQWRASKALIEGEHSTYSFELGFAAFFVNRTSRAGIVLGSGPIGGYEQSGSWKIDARFYRDTITRRLKWIGENRTKISVSNLPAVDFLKLKSVQLKAGRSLYFVDPPYVKAGARLYLNGMLDEGHVQLAKFLNRRKKMNWVVTYDDHPLVRKLYNRSRVRLLGVNYSLGKARKESEVLITPN